jgi:tetratricopeptide (TPR) repeat protein
VTRLAALHARITGDSSGFVTAAQRAEDAAESAAAAMGAANARAGSAGLSGAATGVRGAFAKLSTSPGMRMLPLQLSQVAQQAAAGGGVLRALSIQAADIGLAFGTVGAIVGTLATVAMPLLIGAFSKGKGEAGGFSDELERLTTLREDLQGTLDLLNTEMGELIEKYGTAALAVREYAVELAQIRYQQAISETRDFQLAIESVGAAFIATTQQQENRAGFRNLRNELGITTDEAYRLRDALEALQAAEGIDEQIEASRELDRIMKELGVSADDVDGSLLAIQAALLEAGIAGAELERVMANIRDRATEAAAAAQDIPGAGGGGGGAAPVGGRGSGPGGVLVGSREYQDLLYSFAPDDDDERRRGGGGGRSRPEDVFERDLETLRSQLESEMETEREAHEKRLEMLDEALRRELLTHEEYNRLIEAERERHHNSLSGMDVYRYGSGVQQAEQFMGDMASAFATGNEEMMRIAKVFGAAESLINAWRTFSQVMADPTLPWFAKIPAAVALFGSAVSAVSAIQGVGKGGSGRRSAGTGGGGRAAAAVSGGGDPGGAAEPSAGGGSVGPRVSLTLIGEQGFSRGQIVQIMEAINEAGDDGSIVEIRGRR